MRDSYDLDLVERCKACKGTGTIGQKLDGAHGALADVKASTVVICHQMEAFTQNEDESVQLPRAIDALHALQFPGMIDLDGKFHFVDGVPCFTNWGRHAGRRMKDVPTDYYDFIVKSDFSVEVKAIAGKARLKEFPTP